MQNIMRILSNEIVFWMAWVVIPLVMEIIPSLFGAIILLRKKIRYKKDKDIAYFPNINIIVPVYNSADTLEACLSSIDASTYPNENIDITLVNNGSVDDSFKVFTTYQEQHTDMNMVWMNAKQGKSKALNMALFNSEGKYIIHIDSDGMLHPDAIMNIVKRFENHENVHCMTGSVLTNPDSIDAEKNIFSRIFKKTEFYEYAQAFLAGRNYEAELNSIFTMSGAFSAFRKSTILKTQLYNTETVCEDTHVTFQVRYLLRKKIDICENAVFFVEPMESVGKLYIQRQRWQRGEIEVIHMFPDKKNMLGGFLTNFMSRILLYDHTFAFPRMIWYFALICLAFIGYPFSYIVISLVLIYVLYTISAFLYYLNVCMYTNWDKKLRSYYARKVLYVFLLPLFNFMIYWFRFAGIINSIKGTSTWRTRSFREELNVCKDIILSDLMWFRKQVNKGQSKIYKDIDNEK